MGKRIFIILGILIIVFVLFGLGFAYFVGFGFSENEIYIPVETNPENLPSYLEQSQMIRDMPKDAKWQFNFGEKSYFYNQGRVGEGIIENAEIIIKLPESYIYTLGQKGICDSLKEANSKGELVFESQLSGTDLLFRYSKLSKYRSCLS